MLDKCEVFLKELEKSQGIQQWVTFPVTPIQVEAHTLSHSCGALRPPVGGGVDRRHRRRHLPATARVCVPARGR